MVQGRIKFLVLTAVILILQGCSKTPEEHLIDTLESRYANLYVNEEHKRSVIALLETYFQNNNLTQENSKQIKDILHRLGDGHVVLYNKEFLTEPHYLSSLEFYPGSEYVKSCLQCSPVIENGKYEIVEVNKLSLRDFIDENLNSFAASSVWGREYRILRSLVENENPKNITLKLKDNSGRTINTDLLWNKKDLAQAECVTGERISENIFRLNILSLWCDDRRIENEGRDLIFENFKSQFDRVLEDAKETDMIILDLRENGGGGDLEVEYVLNTFNQHSTFMYKYQYLRRNSPGIMKWIEAYLPFQFQLWANEEYMNSDPQKGAKHRFYDNKIVTLISSGCFSSCEGLASTLKLENRSILLGSKTHGGAGDPLLLPIQGTPFLLNIPMCIVWQKDGNLFEGRGVYPTLEVVQNFAENSDTVLNFAIDQAQ